MTMEPSASSPGVSSLDGTLMSAADREALRLAIEGNYCTVVRGSTGCGKTTQLPQLLLAAGFGPVCVTQPRRMAAIAAARRVAQERGGEVGGEVGYAIRFEQECGPSTQIKFVTDGVLLREAVRDQALSHYGAVVLDEAHERSINTDVLLTVAKQILSGLQGGEAAGEGAGEAAGRARGPRRLVVASATLDAARFSRFFRDAPVVEVHHVAKPLTSDGARLEAALEVHPLHASLPSADQARVFRPPPPRTRRLILATNIAETSLTLPGVRTVIDAGVAKEKRYERDRGMEVLSVVPISQSNAVQRAGRAGRTAAGEVWRLYSEDQLAGMASEPQPEIRRSNLANVVLSLKEMGALDWLDPPEPEAVHAALRQLFLLGALDGRGELTAAGAAMAQLPLEPSLSKTMLTAAALGCRDEAASVCALVCGEEVFCRAGPPWLREAAAESRLHYESADGDHMTLLSAYEDWALVPHYQREAWCAERGLQGRALRAAHSVRTQILSLLSKSGPRGGGEEATAAHSAAEARARCRRAICAGHFMHAARRAHAVRAFVTLGEPPQTVQARAGNEQLLSSATHVVFSELAWVGRLVMQHACAVEPAWLQELTPRLAEAKRVLRLGGVGGHWRGDGEVGAGAEAGGGGGGRPAGDESGPPGPAAARRNNDATVAAARLRLEERRKRARLP
ncbi:ATP-dependent RNA helicase [Emiliania huxleyi CCMP1516]|uniref:RNA helicase n=2 Tax=Emiliania huxleyi TaxID=2903 RepID=A0A0D3JRH0_EMIH1|nr:ATP-dependent RNA helicase [Emiliania huxleyi CCMP1516]EOD26105.1 ATP-dependent RNA helicase [Emiliania huxleyi CCMP1516]|eukprot:XP_005778534.1 ATP-dependent RNA helicase [Emiliania huxleyi CCMP1516]